MNRRKALILLGTITATLVGDLVMASDEKEKSSYIGEIPAGFEDLNKPMNILFNTERLGNIIIVKKDGTQIVISWDEIIEALEE